MSTTQVAGGEQIWIGAGWPQPLLVHRADRFRVALLTQLGPYPIAVEVQQRFQEQGLTTTLLSVPPGEDAKELKIANQIYRDLATAGIERGDTIVGVGGGSVTDLAGFVGSTWLRGVEVVQVPTTLLAAVDAAIGGKTGVNLDGKNLVGTFWSPTQVIVNMEVLAQLPTPILTEGWAEIIKAGFIASPDLLTRIEQALSTISEPSTLDPELFTQIVTGAIAVKAEVVGDDPREAGRRAILNFGHTVGHALETLTGVSHGQAVAWGMLAEAQISHTRFGFDPTRLQEIIDLAGLNQPLPPTDIEQVLLMMTRDKKRAGGQHRMVLLSETAVPELVTVSAEEIGIGLEFIGL